MALTYAAPGMSGWFRAHALGVIVRAAGDANHERRWLRPQQGCALLDGQVVLELGRAAEVVRSDGLGDTDDCTTRHRVTADANTFPDLVL
jgi:hypothetical protein